MLDGYFIYLSIYLYTYTRRLTLSRLVRLARLLILQSNVDVPFVGGNDMVFLRTLQSGQLDEGLLEDADSISKMGFGDDEGWSQTDDVFMRGFSLLKSDVLAL